jgi:hypothetical protein
VAEVSPLSPGAQALTTIASRIDEETTSKDSLERRAQFLVATGATSASIFFAALTWAQANAAALGAVAKSTGLAALALDLLATVLAIFAQLPIRYDQIKDSDLKAWLSEAQLISTDMSSAINMGQERLASLLSLTKNNSWKAALVFISCIAIGLAQCCLSCCVASYEHVL